MTKESRITELTKRQVYYGSSMTVKLFTVKGKLHYKIYTWIDEGASILLTPIDTKALITEGKYEGQDPDEMIKAVEDVIGKRKLGKRVTRGIST